MTPFLIDKRQLLTLVVTFVSVVFISLGVGYSVGYQQLVKVEQISFIATKLSLPTVNAKSSFSDIEMLSNNIDFVSNNFSSNEPGANIDVDAPDVIFDQTIQVNNQNNLKEISEKSEGNKKSDVMVTASLATQVIDNNYLELLEEKSEIEKTSSNDFNKEFINDTASIDEAKYTIQVGYFSKKRNAENKVYSLLEDSLSGYSTTSINKEGETWYNVRFGYFGDKMSAASALKTYQQDYSGNGYVFKIRQKQDKE